MDASNLFSSTSAKWVVFWKAGDMGSIFFGSVSFGYAKEMNAPAAA
jgi:hypothetical protein